jgi:hypothetical protein
LRSWNELVLKNFTCFYSFVKVLQGMIASLSSRVVVSSIWRVAIVVSDILDLSRRRDRKEDEEANSVVTDDMERIQVQGFTVIAGLDHYSVVHV